MVHRSIALSCVFSWLCEVGSEYRKLFATFDVYIFSILLFFSIGFINFRRK
jgi:hypothetical protein